MRVINLLQESEVFQRVIKSKSKIACKFVYLLKDEKGIVILGPLAKFRYHAWLVKYFCDHNNVSSGWLKKPDDYRIYDKQYKIVGGGWLELNHAAKTVAVFGHSTTYGKAPYDKVINILSRHPDFSEYVINERSPRRPAEGRN
ncbi:MAG: hypothetical protein GXO93_05585 [FCB group bacterium]|nr:hypothetical protein [FCB group bacterium]